MASIIERRNKFSVSYRYRSEQGESKQKWETWQTKKDATTRVKFIEFYQAQFGSVLVPLEEAYVQKTLNKEEPTTPKGDKSETLLKDFLKVFVKMYGTSRWGLNTYSSKIGTIDHYINPIIGDVRLCDIDTEFLSNYYHDLLKVKQVPYANRPASGKAVTSATIKKIHDIVHCALKHAIIWNYLDSRMQNPATYATRPKRKKGRREVWDLKTFKTAVQLAEDELLVLCLHICFSCSMRIGEVLGLQWSDMHVENENILKDNAHLIITKELSRVSYSALQNVGEDDIYLSFPTVKGKCATKLVLKTPKTDSSNRRIWIPKTLAYMLQEHKRKQEEVKEFLGIEYRDYDLVVAQTNGRPCESRIIRQAFQELCKNHDLKKVDLHSLRHLSTGYKLKLTNGDLKAVQGDTGHAESDMIMDVYTRIIDEDRRATAVMVEDDFYSQISLQSSVAEKKENDSLAEVQKFMETIPESVKDALNAMNQMNLNKESMQMLFALLQQK